MNGDISNDNEANPSREPDAHGQAAMVLVESLIHGLIDREVLGVAEAVDIVDTAVEVEGELGREPGVSTSMQSPADLLQAISASLATDLGSA